ncbi:MAG: hypothetical protein JRJ69_10135 [Deltaproteobacteria bacterium]|nr:hypothetical protein [Deltaproteobacteria bacterium]
MNLIKKLLAGCLTGVFLFLFSGIILFPLPSPAATASVKVIHSQDKYPAGDSYPILFKIRIGTFFSGISRYQVRGNTIPRT